MGSQYQPRYNLDHVCPGCGAEAVRVPAEPPETGQLVMVPHGPACPVAVQVAEMRAHAQAVMGMQCPAGGPHSWVDVSAGKVQCSKCGAVEQRGR